MIKRIKQLKKYIETEIWVTDLEKVSKLRRSNIRLAQILTLGIKSFNEDKLNLRASALTYFTVLSIVPVLALGFGIAKGFGLEEVLEREISKNLVGQQQVLDYILTFVRSMLNNAKGGLIAGFGLGLLLWSVVKLLNNIENSFNTVWDVKKPRTFVRKLSDYLSIMLIAPIFIVLSSSISIYISSTISNISNNSMFNFTSTLYLQFAKIIPYIIIWSLFTIIYIAMPNTTVKFRSALIAGIIAGTIFQVFQETYLFFQSRATRINAIYGSFAALPLFLIWMQISWFVVLLGAEISYAVQNVKLKGAEIMHKHISFLYQKKLAVLITKNIIDKFENGQNAPNSAEIASELKLPINSVEYVLENLENAKIIAKTKIKNEELFLPAKSTNIIDFFEVLSKYETYGLDNSKFILDKKFKSIEHNIDEIYNSVKNSEKNILLKDI